MRLALAIIVFALASCAGPGKSRFARAAYLAMPQSVSVGVLSPMDMTNIEHRGFVSLTFNWLLRPAYTPTPMPSLK
jgi:hypothetical protein